MNISTGIDTQKTRRKVRDFLKKYRSLAIKSGQTLDRDTSPLLEGMLTPAFTEQHESATQLAEISRILLKLPRDSRLIIALRYCVPETLNAAQIAERVGLGDNVAGVEFYAKMALIEFAKAYKGGELLEYKQGGTKHG